MTLRPCRARFDQYLVCAATSVTLQIERDVGVADFPQPSRHTLDETVVHKSLKLAEAHPDPGEKMFVGKRMMPHSHIVETGVAQERLGGFDHAQFFFGNLFPIGDATA